MTLQPIISFLINTSQVTISGIHAANKEMKQYNEQYDECAGIKF